MLVAAHALTGGMAGELVGDPFWALFFGVISHFLLDAIPHFDTTDGGKFTPRQIFLILADGIFFLIILWCLFNWDKISGPLFWWGMAGGLLPDVVSQFPPLKRILAKQLWGRGVLNFHSNIQRVKLSAIPGLLIQIVVCLLAVSVLILAP